MYEADYETEDASCSCLPALTRNKHADANGVTAASGLRPHASFAGEGMQTRTGRSAFQVLDVTILAIITLRPAVERVRAQDRDLGEQLRRALSSIALNIAEGNKSRGGHRLARFSSAAGSTAEARAALLLGSAWGYTLPAHVDDGVVLLDRVAAMLYRLGGRR